MIGPVKDKLIALALAKMPPTSLRLGMLELAGTSTNEALDQLGIDRTHRYRAIADLRRAGIDGPSAISAASPQQESGQPRITWQTYAKENGLTGDWSRARFYSMTRLEAHALFLKQAGRCYLCGDPLPPSLSKVHIEHDHACCPGPGQPLGLGSRISCGKCVRGIACSACNRLIGAAQDDPYRLRRIADNLEGANHRVATARLRARWPSGE